MSESIDPELAAFEDDLRRLAPNAGRVDRDELLFAGGRAAAKAGRWRVATACLAALSLALAALAGEVREPVVAHLWGGLTFVQIGELMGTSAGTAHRRYLEGLAELRRRLRVECPNSSTLN